MSDIFDWTPAAIAQLRALWDEGLSTYRIAERMGTTKNAVVGKAHRLDLPGRASPIRRGGVVTPPKPRAAGKVTLPPLASPAPVAPPPAPMLPVPVAMAPVLARVAPPPSLPVRPGRACCWPIGDTRATDFRFCDAAAAAGRPYCATHCDRAYDRSPRATLAGGVMRALAVLALLLAGPAAAAPPPVGSEQWEILHPHRAWVEGVAGPHGVCCSLADGRAVEARRQGDGWQVLFPAERGFPAGWQDVPEAAVLGGENPVGMPVAWWHGGAVRCFVPGSGT